MSHLHSIVGSKTKAVEHYRLEADLARELDRLTVNNANLRADLERSQTACIEKDDVLQECLEYFKAREDVTDAESSDGRICPAANAEMELAMSIEKALGRTP